MLRVLCGYSDRTYDLMERMMGREKGRESKMAMAVFGAWNKKVPVGKSEY